jgi:hypothetical protein
MVTTAYLCGLVGGVKERIYISTTAQFQLDILHQQQQTSFSIPTFFPLNCSGQNWNVSIEK